MKKLSIYLDTSVINFLFAFDAPDYMKATQEFFDGYLDEFRVYISDITLLEIKKTSDRNKHDLLMTAIEKYGLEVYKELNKDIEAMAREYIKKGVIPAKKFEDALHIAFATYYEFDILLSWNFRHLANIKKQKEINLINSKNGYLKPLTLINPLEVIYEK